jgi:tetratricopeptide (TPR) repeat protein
MRLAVAACIVACAYSAPVAADAPADAEQAFERGRALLDAGKLDEACAAFADSLRLDFQYGTLYNLGRCEDKRGKPYAAWRSFRRLADEDTNAARRARAAALATQLEPRVPKLVIDVPAGRPAGFAVSIDGEIIAELGAPQPVDVGSHEIVATAPGFQRWRTTITAGEGATMRVRPALEHLLGGDDVHVDVRPDRRYVRDFPVAGPAVTVAGGVTLVAGIALALHAKNIYDSSKTGAAAGAAGSLDDNRQAVRDGNIATVLSVVGLVAVPAGAVLWHRGTWMVTPRADGNGAALSVSGQF